MAKVRISRVVQKGMEIRNSQNARRRADRVATNHAVGSPMPKEINVVVINRRTERQKIVRMKIRPQPEAQRRSRSTTIRGWGALVGCDRLFP